MERRKARSKGTPATAHLAGDAGVVALGDLIKPASVTWALTEALAGGKQKFRVRDDSKAACGAVGKV